MKIEEIVRTIRFIVNFRFIISKSIPLNSFSGHGDIPFSSLQYFTSSSLISSIMTFSTGFPRAITNKTSYLSGIFSSSQSSSRFIDAIMQPPRPSSVAPSRYCERLSHGQHQNYQLSDLSPSIIIYAEGLSPFSGPCHSFR